MGKRISRFDFKRANIDAMISHLAVVNWPDVFLVNDIETFVGQFYYVIDECFDLYVLKFVAGGPDVKNPWFDRELRNLDSNKIKAHKFMKRVSKIYKRTYDDGIRCALCSVSGLKSRLQVTSSNEIRPVH
jgi:hypothetical protein